VRPRSEALGAELAQLVLAETPVPGFGLPLHEFDHAVGFFELLERVPHGVAIVVPLNPLLKEVGVDYF